ncbi:hypothetical protein GS421_00545 [Rhodococcus hoagii]|nr:hypothetical protein [Prescottella equi]
MSLTGHVDEFGRTLGEELLEPTKIYARTAGPRGRGRSAHLLPRPGGGLANKMARVMPKGLVAELDRGTWSPAPIFTMIAQRGRVERAEMEQTFNMGVGMGPSSHDRSPRGTSTRAMAVLTHDTSNAGHSAEEGIGRRRRACAAVGDHPRLDASLHPVRPRARRRSRGRRVLGVVPDGRCRRRRSGALLATAGFPRNEGEPGGSPSLRGVSGDVSTTVNDASRRSRPRPSASENPRRRACPRSLRHCG